MGQDPGVPLHFLVDWLDHKGLRQADIVRDLNWNRAKISLIVSGKQDFTGSDLQELGLYLGAKPYELLMPPASALAIREIAKLGLEGSMSCTTSK